MRTICVIHDLQLKPKPKKELFKNNNFCRVLKLSKKIDIYYTQYSEESPVSFETKHTTSQIICHSSLLQITDLIL